MMPMQAPACLRMNGLPVTNRLLSCAVSKGSQALALTGAAAAAEDGGRHALHVNLDIGSLEVKIFCLEFAPQEKQVFLIPSTL